MFRLGYNSNGFGHHRTCVALELLEDIGYEAVALTLDAGRLDPLEPDADEVARVRATAEELGLELVVETGSPFLLDPRREHFPGLLEEKRADRARRRDFLERCIDLAADVGATTLSLGAGAAPGGVIGDRGEAGCEAEWDHLCEGILPLLARGHGQGVQIGFGPEAGSFIEGPAGYGELVRRLGAAGDELGLSLVVEPPGRCEGGDVEGTIRALGKRLVLVRLGGAGGEIDGWSQTLNCLLEVGYGGIVSVERPRDSHRAPRAAEEAMGQLRAALGS
jgi:L-ribulose-5-phosphate 3-epimerase